MYSSEKQLNTSIKNKDTKSLKEIAKDNKTYQFLKAKIKFLLMNNQIIKVAVI